MGELLKYRDRALRENAECAAQADQPAHLRRRRARTTAQLAAQPDRKTDHQLRALWSDHPVDGPSFDQYAMRVALSFGRVVAEDEPAGQLGRRTQHSLVMLDHGI